MLVRSGEGGSSWWASTILTGTSSMTRLLQFITMLPSAFRSLPHTHSSIKASLSCPRSAHARHNSWHWGRIHQPCKVPEQCTAREQHSTKSNKKVTGQVQEKQIKAIRELETRLLKPSTVSVKAVIFMKKRSNSGHVRSLAQRHSTGSIRRLVWKWKTRWIKMKARKNCKVKEDPYINVKLERRDQGKWCIPVFVMPLAKEEQASKLRHFSPTLIPWGATWISTVSILQEPGWEGWWRMACSSSNDHASVTSL